MKDLRQAFAECMEIIYGFHPVPDNQLSDIVRIFIMGWCESLRVHDDYPALQQIAQLMLEVADARWSPDDSWRWWLNSN